MNQSTKTIFQWVGVLPGAILAGILATFPLHWVLYFTLARGETISGVNIEPIEFFLYPFVIAVVYIHAGGRIAPAHRFRTVLVLAALYIATQTAMLLFGQSVLGPSTQIEFGARSVTALLGILVGVVIAWKQEGEKSQP